jgi:hypothetical protein
MIDIATKYESGKAVAINEAGVVVGDVHNHAFVYDSRTKTIKLLGEGTVQGKAGGASYAYDINNANQVVGYSESLIGSRRAATLWEAGKAHDLNKLVPASSGWNFEFAKSINDKGQILVMGTLNGFQRAALLTPNRATVTSGTLRLTASPANDVVNIQVRSNKIGVTVNDATQWFSKSAVKRMSIDLGEGDDIITIAATAPAANIWGRGGNDTFNVRNGAKDYIDAGLGSDRAQVDGTDTRLSVEQLLK